eukprot:TRINITY_DN14576_c0_g2_i1.p3 TRINITY_DN14576_c0_g2~~TRINITY_DN14576_c0_g2_i1.p3  ORF type:complete len:116 (-),score=1.70 TRINITY_DN14576_c0_g2_i1:122-469(-)
MAIICLCLQYIYFALPVVIFISGLACFPILQFIQSIVNLTHSDSTGINFELIQELPVQKYTDEFKQIFEECCICMCEYETNDLFIQLPCNYLHTFHEECIKRWLAVNKNLSLIHI